MLAEVFVRKCWGNMNKPALVKDRILWTRFMISTASFTHAVLKHTDAPKQTRPENETKLRMFPTIVPIGLAQRISLNWLTDLKALTRTFEKLQKMAMGFFTYLSLSVRHNSNPARRIFLKYFVDFLLSLLIKFKFALNQYKLKRHFT
jgi:hypothetical protein